MSTPTEPGLEEAMSERRHLLALAYRLLGSAAEAEDAVQETYVRWYAMTPHERAAIVSPGAWMTTVVSRICLNVLRSARVRREAYIGDWLPEPVPGRAGWTTLPDSGATADPADRITLDESITMAFLVVLEAMTPAERVALVLHDVFAYPFDSIGEITGRSAAACRQLASSARRRIRAAHVPVTPTGRQTGVVQLLKAAWSNKDIDAIMELLDPDVMVTADGGGRAEAFSEPIRGADNVARAWLALADGTHDSLAFEVATVNGQPGLVVRQDRRAVAVYAFDVADDRIRRVWVVRNPDKLRAWQAVETDASSDSYSRR